MAITVTVAVEKGGVGKTTTCVNLAAAMAAAGKKVLAVDMDTQANCTYFLTGNKKRTEAYKNRGVAEMLRAYGLVEPGAFIHPTQIPGVDIIPSNAASVTLPETLNTLAQNYADSKNRFLAYCLAKVSEGYDYVLIDTPPNLEVMTASALLAADYLLMPFNAEEQALDGLQNIDELRRRLEQQEDAEIQLLGILLTMTERTAYTNYMRQQVAESEYGKYLLKTEIRKGTAIKESATIGQPAVLCAASSNPAKDYVALYEELKARMEGGTWH